jgi:hypothetical protein
MSDSRVEVAKVRPKDMTTGRWTNSMKLSGRQPRPPAGVHESWGSESVRQLSNHLGAAVSLSRDGYYPSALVVVRAALEHHPLTYGGIGKEKAEAEYARLA